MKIKVKDTNNNVLFQGVVETIKDVDEILGIFT